MSTRRWMMVCVGAAALACQTTPQVDPPASGDDAVPEPSGGDEGLPPPPGSEPGSSEGDAAGQTRPASAGQGRAPGGVGAECGGLAGFSCEEDLFCQFSLEAHCGAADQMGTCQEKPMMCTKEYRPVCGCDGKTYSNACGAHGAGVSVAARGSCPGDEH